MLERHLTPGLVAAASQNPVVTLTGPRQSGKTTLAKAVFPEHHYASLEEPDIRAFAIEDPRGFLSQFARPVILDEVQRAPELFSYVQTLVDADPAPGRFILTGSQNFLLLRSIGQSLAGRTAMLHLHPFAWSELQHRSPLDLSAIGRRVPRSRIVEGANLMRVLFTGSYPRIHDRRLDPARWLADYYRTYVERDVRDIVNVGDLEAFGRFLRLAAGRNGQLLNVSSLAADAGVTHTTARRWISILEASFLILLLRPHHRNYRKRMVKSPKLYFLDTGLLCYLLRIRSPDALHLHASRGAIFESLVISEFVKNATNRGTEADISFWRDSTGHEVDVLLEAGPRLTAVEVKSGQTVASDFFAGLEYWRSLTGDPESPAGLVYGGDRAFRQRGVTVYGWSVL